MIDIHKIEVLAQNYRNINGNAWYAEESKALESIPCFSAESFIAVASPAAVLGLIEEVEALQHWRDLALQFDNHRMQALAHLKALLADYRQPQAARDFLAAQPIAAHEVVAEREKLKSENEKLKVQLADEVMHGYAGAFYQMAEKLGITGPRAASPQQVFENEVMPALLALIADRDRLAADNKALTEDPGSAL